MENITYNNANMNALKLADLIVEKEVAYVSTDYEALSFEDKCLYALQFTPILHPLVSPDRTRRSQMLKALRPELLRRAQREDAFALFVLGNVNSDLSAPATDDERRFLERSMEAGYLPAAFSLLDRFYHGKNRNAPEAAAIMSLLSERMTESDSDEDRFTYYALIGDKENLRTTAIRLASEGDFRAASYLSRHMGDPLDFDSDERVFWETVEFLVLSRLYDKGARHLGDTLGMMLINQRGCLRDPERIKQIYADLMYNFPYDRDQLVTVAGVPHDSFGEDLYEAERVCRLLIKDGKEANYWRLILIALLSGNRQKLWKACDEACAARDGKLCMNVAKAYHMLCHARATA